MPPQGRRRPETHKDQALQGRRYSLDCRRPAAGRGAKETEPGRASPNGLPTRTDSWPRAKGKGRGTAWEPALAISRKHPGGIKRRMSRWAFRPAGRNETGARIGKQERDGKDFPRRTAPARFAQDRGCRAGRRRRSRVCCFFFDLRKAGIAERAAGAGHGRAVFSSICARQGLPSGPQAPVTGVLFFLRSAQGRDCRAGRRRRSRACCFFFDLRKAGVAERAAGAGHERAAFSLTSIKQVSFLLLLSDFLTRCRPGTGRFLPPPALCGKMLPCEALKVRLEKPQKPTA